MGREMSRPPQAADSHRRRADRVAGSAGGQQVNVQAGGGGDGGHGHPQQHSGAKRATAPTTTGPAPQERA
jgi:hypothetical protein